MRERFGRLAVAKSVRSARLLVGKHAAGGGERRDAGALVVAEADANLVLLDHGDIGVGGGLRAADQRLDGGEARLAGLGMQRLQRREPAPAGDEAVGERGRPALGAGGGSGSARASGVTSIGTRWPWRRRLSRSARASSSSDWQAVAGQVVGGDGVEGQVEHHPAGLARARSSSASVVEGRGAGRISAATRAIGAGPARGAEGGRRASRRAGRRRHRRERRSARGTSAAGSAGSGA